MKVRVNLNDINFEEYPSSYVVTVDYLMHNRYGHTEGQVLVLKPDGTVEFGFIGGHTDVDVFSNYSPRQTWPSLDDFVADETVNEITPELAEKFSYYATLAQEIV